MDDGLDIIPPFLQRKPYTPEEHAKLRRKWAREKNRPAVVPQADFKPKLDQQGRPLPRGMDTGSWALLAVIERAAVVKGKEDDAAAKERFRILGVERAERAAIKRAAKAATQK